MYIISGVNEDHKFITSTRFEIGLIQYESYKVAGGSKLETSNVVIQPIFIWILSSKDCRSTSNIKNTWITIRIRIKLLYNRMIQW